MRLTEDQLQFLARFSKSPEGHLFLSILRAKLSEREAKLRTATGEEVYRQQGRALELDELIADVTDAMQKLNRSERTVTSRSPLAGVTREPR